MPKLLDILVPSRSDPDLEFRLREQIPYVALTTFFLCLAYLAVLCFSCVSYGFDFFFITMLVILSVQISALVFLRTGKYRKGASMTTISLLLSSLAVLFLLQYSGNTTMEIFRPLCFVMITMGINVMVAVSNRQIWIFSVPYLAGWLLSFATIFRHYFDMKEESQFAVVSLCLGIVALVWQTVTLLLIRQLSERMLLKAEEQTEKASESVENLTRLISEAKAGMNIGGEIISATNQVQKAVMNVSAIQDYLDKETDRLVTETESMIGSSKKVISNTQKMSGTITAQTAAITETSAAIVEISQNIESINKVAVQRRSMLDDAAASGNSQKARTEKLAAAFTSVMDSTEGISRFVTTVQDIASRTALLSMNASIEAARAGSSGKGFAIVAQEIRSLSGETQKNADMIKQMIEKNDRTVRETGALVKEFSAFIGSNIENTQILINSIDEILTGIAEMNTGTQDMMQTVERLLSGTAESSQIVNDVVAQIDMQQESFNHLSGFAKELNQRILKLREAVTEIRSSTDLVADAGHRNIAQAKKLQL